MTTTSTSFNVISSKDVDGTKVYNPDGHKLGSIDSMMIDKMSGKVRYAVLEFGGFLGMGTDVYPLPWSSLTYDNDMGGYVVAVTKEQLDRAPKYERSTLPEYSEEYGRSIYDYYEAPWY